MRKKIKKKLTIKKEKVSNSEPAGPVPPCVHITHFVRIPFSKRKFFIPVFLMDKKYARFHTGG